MDALLVLMVVIWAANYSVIKRAFEEVPPLPFNALRLAVASAVFLTAIRLARRAAGTGSAISRVFHTPHPLTARDRWDLVWLGLVGHFTYQLCFAFGIDATSVSNSALIIGATPVVVAVASAALGRDRLGVLHWVGAAVSAFGLYIVVGRGAAFDRGTLRGDVLIMTSVTCWAAYTIGAGRLMARHSPLYVTGTTMAIGAAPYGLLALPSILRLHWASINPWTWVALVLSALFALCFCYLIYYTAVQRIGPARTAVYSNLVPISAMIFAALLLGEQLTGTRLTGAAAVLAGVALTRIGRGTIQVPMEE